MRFFLSFLLILGGLFALELTPPGQALVLPWTALLAGFSASLIAPFDPAIVSYGNVLHNQANGFGVAIEAGCNAVEACIVLAAAMLAFPAPWRHRACGLALGFLAVQGLNVVRVISLFYLGQWNDTAFRVAHEYLWQGMIMLDVLVVWLIWVRTDPSQLLGRTSAA